MADTVCFDYVMGYITLTQQGPNSFTVTYGKQTNSELSYARAARLLGEALMHHLACEGILDNSEVDDNG